MVQHLRRCRPGIPATKRGSPFLLPPFLARGHLPLPRRRDPVLRRLGPQHGSEGITGPHGANPRRGRTGGESLAEGWRRRAPAMSELPVRPIAVSSGPAGYRPYLPVSALMCTESRMRAVSAAEGSPRVTTSTVHIFCPFRTKTEEHRGKLGAGRIVGQNPGDASDVQEDQEREQPTALIGGRGTLMRGATTDPESTRPGRHRAS
jgi:hypothetical protein